MLSNGDGSGFGNLAVPQSGILLLTEFLTTSPTAQIANLVSAIYFTNCEIILTNLPIQIAGFNYTC